MFIDGHVNIQCFTKPMFVCFSPHHTFHDHVHVRACFSSSSLLLSAPCKSCNWLYVRSTPDIFAVADGSSERRARDMSYNPISCSGADCTDDLIKGNNEHVISWLWPSLLHPHPLRHPQHHHRSLASLKLFLLTSTKTKHTTPLHTLSFVFWTVVTSWQRYPRVFLGLIL